MLARFRMSQVLAEGGSLDEAKAAAAEEARIEAHRAQEIGRHHHEDPAHPPAPGSFLVGGEKRVSNRRVKEELGVTLQFPTYQEGLRAIASGDLSPWPSAAEQAGGAAAPAGAAEAAAGQERRASTKRREEEGEEGGRWW